MINPTEIESTAKDIVDYWDTSELTDKDKLKILKMVHDHYANNFAFSTDPVDQWLMVLAKRTYERHTDDDLALHNENEQDD